VPSQRKEAASLVQARLQQIREMRPDRPADRVLSRAVAVFGERPPTSQELLSRRLILEKILRKEIPDAVIRVAQRRSLSKSKTCSALMIYEARPGSPSERSIMGAMCYTVVFKTSEIWFISAIEPAGTQSHLFERVVERTGGEGFSFSLTQGIFSDIWAPLLWMRNRRLVGGRGFIPHDFMVPWSGGLFFGVVETIDRAEGAAPMVTVVNSGGTFSHYLPDFYAENGKRIWAFTKTFVDGGKLKPHQINLRDRLMAFVAAHRPVIDYLKLRWMIAAGTDSSFIDEVEDIFEVRRPTDDQMDAAFSSMETIVDSEDWLTETTFSAKSRERHQADAVAKASRPATREAD